MDEYTRHLKELEMDIKPEVVQAITLLTIDPENGDGATQLENLGNEDLENLLLNMTAQHYEAAKYKRRGMSYKSIADKMGLRSPAGAQRMVEQVLTMGYQLSIRDKEKLRQQCLDSLDDMMCHLYSSAEADGREYLKPDEVRVGLSVIDSQIKILGISAPVEVSMNVSARVAEATNKLKEIMTGIQKTQVFQKQLVTEGFLEGEFTENDAPSKGGDRNTDSTIDTEEVKSKGYHMPVDDFVPAAVPGTDDDY